MATSSGIMSTLRAMLIYPVISPPNASPSPVKAPAERRIFDCAV